MPTPGSDDGPVLSKRDDRIVLVGILGTTLAWVYALFFIVFALDVQTKSGQQTITVGDNWPVMVAAAGLLATVGGLILIVTKREIQL